MKNKPETYSKLNYGLEKKSWFKGFRIFLFTSVFIYYLTIAGSKYGSFFKDRIQEQSTLAIVLLNNKVEKGKLIGKTNNMIFLMVGKKVTAVPIGSSVVKIEMQ